MNMHDQYMHVIRAMARAARSGLDSVGKTDVDIIDEVTAWTIIEESALNTPQGTYVPWTDGYAVGYRFEQDGQADQYIYMNPSSDSDDGQPNVFVYMGAHGSANHDIPVNHYDIGKRVYDD